MLQVIKSEGLIYMVLEYGDIDLARLLQRHEVTQKEGGHTELDENFIRLYWQQMLQVEVAPWLGSCEQVAVTCHANDAKEWCTLQALFCVLAADAAGMAGPTVGLL